MPSVCPFPQHLFLIPSRTNPAVAMQWPIKMMKKKDAISSRLKARSCWSAPWDPTILDTVSQLLEFATTSCIHLSMRPRDSSVWSFSLMGPRRKLCFWNLSVHFRVREGMELNRLEGWFATHNSLMSNHATYLSSSPLIWGHLLHCDLFTSIDTMSKKSKDRLRDPEGCSIK